MQNLLKTVRKAVQQYEMIAEGDRIAVGVSGGKDSLVLLLALQALSEFYPKHFEVVGITVDQRFEGTDGDFSAISDFLTQKGIDYKDARRTTRAVFAQECARVPCMMRPSALVVIRWRSGIILTMRPPRFI